MCTNPPKVPRKMSLTNILHPKHTKLLDKALVVHFPAPHSYTGEDSIEFHLHGSLAIQRAMFDALAYFPNCRMAEKGEFTQRAFLNSKIGLAEAENLKDLINAETEQQRLQAMLQFQVHFSLYFSNFFFFLSYLMLFFQQHLCLFMVAV
ncbi:hypothetical protein HMI54_008744 [Coelomomyces lativittatus]|nr:hypothetical protein HMI54_008744 [Coelomomyces lativittatus]KAJ1508642.1 hypothetical protein HMI55_000299 [Coelomomyces lativittatus]